MAIQWFVKRDGKISGPFSSSQLQAAASSGRLRHEFLISNDRRRWVKASEVAGLSFGVPCPTPLPVASGPVQAPPVISSSATPPPLPRYAPSQRESELTTFAVLRRATSSSTRAAAIGAIVTLLVIGATMAGYFLAHSRESEPSSRRKSNDTVQNAPRNAATAARQIAAVEPSKPAPADTATNSAMKNSIGMKLVLIPAGEFTMGSPKDELLRGFGEDQRRLRIPEPFFMSAFTVTQTEYEQVIGKNPSYFSKTGGGKEQVAGLDTTRFPVEMVSWDDAVEFCRKLSALPAEKSADRAYRLPTEAEWEYACRAGTTTPFNFGDAASSDRANVDGRNPYGRAAELGMLGRPSTVGSYRPNALGLFDMHGNVSQWCIDQFDANHPRPDDPVDSDSRPARVIRGGSWIKAAYHCRSAARDEAQPDQPAIYIGFRIVCELHKQHETATQVTMDSQAGHGIIGFNQLTGHTKPVMSVSFLPDDRQIVTASADGTSRLWDFGGQQEIKSFDHKISVRAVAVAPDGRFAVTGCDDKSVHIWGLKDGSHRRLEGHSSYINRVAVSRDGTRILSGGDDGTVRLWDMATGRELQILRAGRANDPVGAIAFSADGKKALSACGATITLWELDSGKKMRDLQATEMGRYEATSVAFSADERVAITGGIIEANDKPIAGDIRLWDLETGIETRNLAGHTGPVYATAVSPGGRMVLSASICEFQGDPSPENARPGTIRLWDMESGGEVVRIPITDGICSDVKFSPDGRRFATCGATFGSNSRPLLKVWDLPDNVSSLHPSNASPPFPTETIPVSDGERLITQQLRFPTHGLAKQSYYIIDSAGNQLGHGPSTMWWVNGAKRSCETWNRGVPQGAGALWWENGQLALTCACDQGVRRGSLKVWNEQGEEIVVANYLHGKMTNVTVAKTAELDRLLQNATAAGRNDFHDHFMEVKSDLDDWIRSRW